jgi:hypothetical protein
MDEKSSKEDLPAPSSQDPEANGFAPIATRGSTRSGHLAVSRTTTRGSTRRYGGQDGYSIFSSEEDELQESGSDHEEIDEQAKYEVTWDGGDADPLNPRRFGHLRKWWIVLVLSASSLCV